MGSWTEGTPEVALELDCEWHTINDTVSATGLRWSTSIVDLEAGRLLDVVEGRSVASA